MNRVYPLREGSGESLRSQVVRRLPLWEVPKEFSKKFYRYQRLGYRPVAFSLQKMPGDIEAHHLRAVRISDVKLLIFQP